MQTRSTFISTYKVDLQIIVDLGKLAESSLLFHDTELRDRSCCGSSHPEGLVRQDGCWELSFVVVVGQDEAAAEWLAAVGWAGWGSCIDCCCAWCECYRRGECGKVSASRWYLGGSST